MLWTVVVALYLGIVGVLQVDLSIFAVFTGWLIVVGVLRIAVGSKVAGVLSILAGLPLCVFVLCQFEWFIFPCFIIVFGGPVFGLVLFLIVEGGFRVVDWADNLMRTKTDD
jgi:hypothetical protein